MSVRRQIVQTRYAYTAQLEHITKALGRDESGYRAFALDDRVRRDSRAVYQSAALRGAEAELAEHPVQDPEDAALERVRRRDALADVDSAVVLDDHDIGEGAADVDTDGIAAV